MIKDLIDKDVYISIKTPGNYFSGWAISHSNTRTPLITNSKSKIFYLILCTFDV
jgi:hypothetical protein